MNVTEIYQRAGAKYAHGEYMAGSVEVDDVQNAYNLILNERDWVFATKHTTAIADGEGDIQLPDDLKTFVKPKGRRGSSVWVDGDTTFTYPIYIVNPENIGNYDSVDSGTYTIFYRDIEQNKLLYQNGQKRANTKFNIVYQRKPETLTDTSVPQIIPEEHHEVIVLRLALDSFLGASIGNESVATYREVARRYEDSLNGLIKADNNLYKGQ